MGSPLDLDTLVATLPACANPVAWGQKASGLALAGKAGVVVPRGVVLSAEFTRQYCADKLSRGVPGSCAAARARLLEEPLPAELLDRLVDLLPRAGAPVLVRGSHARLARFGPTSVGSRPRIPVVPAVPGELELWIKTLLAAAIRPGQDLGEVVVEPLAVLLQEFVPATAAGIALSGRQDGHHEAPDRVFRTDVPGAPVPDEPLRSEVLRALRELETTLGGAVDSEWVAGSEGLYIVQVGPRKTGFPRTSAAVMTSPGPSIARDRATGWARRHVDWHLDKRAYLDEWAARCDLEIERWGLVTIELGHTDGEEAECVDDALRQLGFRTASVAVVGPLSDRVHERTIADLRASMVEDLRFLRELARDDVASWYLLEFEPATRWGYAASRGSAVVVETYEGGPPGAGRGASGTVMCSIGEDGALHHPVGASLVDALDEVANDQWSQLASLVGALDDEYGAVVLEWFVSEGGALYLWDLTCNPAVPATIGTSLSPGDAVGIALVLRDLDPIEAAVPDRSVHVDALYAAAARSSMATAVIDAVQAHETDVVVVAPMAHPSLAVIAPYVAGFVFDDAPLFCHLAIILRGLGIPAAVLPQATTTVRPGECLRFRGGLLERDTLVLRRLEAE